MAIHLNAEQKNLKRLYSSYDTLIIPPYQRPYSWTITECRQLYDDLLDAFGREGDRDYFVGTIILAVADGDETESPRIIDGQQRLTTFWLLFKALSVLLPDVTTLTDCLYSKEWDGSGKRIRIKSQVNDRNDSSEMAQVDTWDEDTYEKTLAQAMEPFRGCKAAIEACLPDDCDFQKNATVYFYQRLKDLRDEWDMQQLREFARFLLTSVYILPIEMHAPGIRDAENKALTIFETINNRGMELSNSDIFKARLYSKALVPEQRDSFIEMWDNVVKACTDITIDIDHLFTIYMYILASKQDIDVRPSDIREFFDGRNGVLSRSSYGDVMTDLSNICNILSLYKSRSAGTSRIAGWLQMLPIGDDPKIDAIIVAWDEHGDHQIYTEDAFFIMLVKFFVMHPYPFQPFITRKIIKDLLNGRMSRTLQQNAESVKGELPVRPNSILTAKLAMILEMGGGLLPSKTGNLVNRRGSNPIPIMDIGSKTVFIDAAIGNLCFIPLPGSTTSKEYEDYMKRLSKVDPECAKMVDDRKIKYSPSDIKERGNRKTRILKKFFSQV